MDKNKSRSDLLAAGRKKLQQFRKKKDNKGSGSQGNSSKIPSKLDQQDTDTDIVTVADKSPSGSYSTDDVLAPHVDYNPQSLDSVATPSTELSSATEIDHSSIPVSQETSVAETSGIHHAKVPMQEVGCREDFEFPVQNAEVAGVISVEPLIAIDAEQNSEHIYNFPSTAFSRQTSDSMEGQARVDEVWGGSKEEGLLPSQPVSLLQAKEDAKEDADCVALEQSDQVCKTKLEGDEQLPLLETSGTYETVLGTDSAETISKETCCDEEETIQADVASVSGAATESNDDSICNPGEKSGTLNSSSSGGKDSKEEAQFHMENTMDSSRYHLLHVPEDSFADRFKGHELSVQTNVKISGGGDRDTKAPKANMTTISDAQSGTFFSFGQDSKFLNLLERVKEELIITSFSNDLFTLQIAEQNEIEMELDSQHYKLTNEISLLNTSLDEVTERNQSLAGELSQCRSELVDVSNAREELITQLLNAETVIEKLSSRANESENSLEKFHGDMLRLSKELDDCKHLVTVLEKENERLNGIIISESENTRKLTEEKELYICENEKISSELSSCKSLMVALEVENSKLLTKLEEEREHLSRENGTFLVELANFKNLVATQQEEITNLSKSLALVTEDRTKLEEDKKLLFHENEKLTSEPLVLHERLSTEHAERIRFEDDLRDALVRLEQLTEENISLSNSLDIHKYKIEEIHDQRFSIPSRYEEDGNPAEIADFGWHHGSKSQQKDSCQIHLKKHVEATSSIVLAGGMPFSVAEQEIFDDSLGFVTLSRHLEEANLILQKLEKEIRGLRPNAISSNRSDSKVPAPAVSKLIQAFESKVNVDEHEVEAESQLPIDPCELSKELMESLRALFHQIVVDSENASVLLKGERDHRKVAMSTLKELKDQFKALEDDSNDLLIANIELGVLFESLKLHVDDAGRKICELEILNESLKQYGLNQNISNSELAERLSKYQLSLTKSQNQLCDLQESSSEMVSSICNQLDDMQKVAIEKVMMLENDWHSFLLQLAETISKLDKSLGKAVTSTITICTPNQLHSYIAASVIDVIKMMDDLKEKLQATGTDCEAFRMLHDEVTEKYDNLCRRTELSVGMLHKIHRELQKLYIASCGSSSSSDMNMQVEKLADPVEFSNFGTLIKPLENCISERWRLESVNSKLQSDLEDRTVEYEELSKRCLDSIGIESLIKDVQSVLMSEDAVEDMVEMSALYLESIVLSLLQKYRETELQLGLSREESGSLMMKLTELNESMCDLSSSILEHEHEILVLKESLSQAQEALIASRFELKDKANELALSEQRVSSIREKLSIAVAKGKGLIVQRDSLKQSLAQTSSDLERCLQELQLKDIRIHEMETKLKTYSEAGERVEALESELSYIRNSATALRESFLLKDSVLQRIEEILEELDLPENFHSKDIIEKVDWLAKSNTGDTLPHTDWDQRSSVAGGSGSDANFVVMDAWKDDVPPDAMHGDDVRRRYEELQSKFYALAEQNEMLEQSLMERNSIVQRWEELLERIDIPPHLRSTEPDDKIEWLGRSFSEACHDRNALQQRVNNLENYCGLISAEMDESKIKVSDVEAELQSLMLEREKLFEKMELAYHHNEELSFWSLKNEIENVILQNEFTNMHESLVFTECELVKLEALLSKALQVEDKNYMVSDRSVEVLQVMVMKLIESCTASSLGKPVLGRAVNEHDTEEMSARSIDTLDAGQQDINFLKKEMEDALLQLKHVTGERDRYMEMHESLLLEVGSLGKKRDELQEMLIQEEQKSTSAREKLNVAVRKGKSLVQQRDSLKQSIEEMTSELEHLKSRIKYQDNTLASYEQKIRDLSIYSGQVQTLESQNLFLKNQLRETESTLQEKERKLSSIISTLGHIDVDVDVNMNDPIERLEQIGKVCSELREAMFFSEQESVKSKRAAELLLAELDEVQERNDGFQEELARASDEIVKLTKERDLAESSKLAALSEIEKLSTLLSKERKVQFSQFMGLKSGLDQLKEALHEINCLLADTFSKDLDVFYSLEAAIESCNKPNGAADVILSPSSVTSAFKSRDLQDQGKSLDVNSLSDSYTNVHLDENVATEIYGLIGHHLEELMKETGALKKLIVGHSVTFQERSGSLSKVLEVFHREFDSQKELVEALKRDVRQMESVAKDKETECDILCRNLAVLYEACTVTVKEVGERKGELMRNDLNIGNLEMSMSSLLPDQLPLTGKTNFYSEEYIRSVADRLLSAVREFIDLKAETSDYNLKEMKLAIANLQKERQEKDIQKERICMELVSQIKEAEATATSYSLDLQASKDKVRELEKVTEQMDSERKVLEQRLAEMQNGLSTSEELKERVRSLMDLLVAKDQEIEALMHALDEEEVQMDDLTDKIEELEKVLKQKNQELDSIEIFRGKLMKKLSITVTKFDELHHLSESLLTEVEKLQSQLQDRDSEISFLRQEVTRCTNDALIATQTSNRNSEDIHEILMWFDMMKAGVGLSHIVDEDKEHEVCEYKEILKKKITSILTEIEDLQAESQRKDEMLQAEKIKVEELKRKELQVNLLEDVGDYDRASSVAPEIIESEPLINKWAVSSTSVTPQVRSLRKGNSDHVAISIDPASSSNRLDDEDDDKVHGFKSLASSRIVPKFSRRLTDMIDGLWVSCDRTLMRQPALRLGIIIYWAILHSLLATFVV